LYPTVQAIFAFVSRGGFRLVAGGFRRTAPHKLFN
jgi:hypothetical protein